jgi:low temperature requirement protein LtrA
VLAAGVALAIAGAMTLWWAYFDFPARGMERALRMVEGRARGDLARDMFTILHYPLVLGVILFAVAAKKTVADPLQPLSETGLIALAAGIAAFLLGSVAVRWRGIHVVARERLVAVIAIPVGLVVLREVPALALLAVAVAAMTVALAFETHRMRSFRAMILAE